MKTHNNLNLSILEISLFLSAVVICSVVFVFGISPFEPFWQNVVDTTFYELEQHIAQPSSFY